MPITHSRRKPPPLRCVFGVRLRFSRDVDCALVADARAAGVSVNRMAEIAALRGRGV